MRVCAGVDGTANGDGRRTPNVPNLVHEPTTKYLSRTLPNPTGSDGNAGSGLPLADVAWTQPLSANEVARSAVKCCLEGIDSLGGGRGKDSGDAVVLKVQDIAQMAA